MERVAAPMKAPDPFYKSQEWLDLRDTLLRQRGRRCEKCGKTAEDDGAPVRLIADHIVERKDGGAELDPGNIQFLCVAEGGNGRPQSGRSGGCHNRKTMARRSERMGEARA